MRHLGSYARRPVGRSAGGRAGGVRVEDYRRWGRAGIRARWLDTRTRKLEMDFVIQGDERSMHVLNAVSPGWTCSIPFARHVVDQIEERTGGR